MAARRGRAVAVAVHLPDGPGPMVKPFLSIVIPVLNEAGEIAACLGALQSMRNRGVELIVADGGSSDGTVDLALPLADNLVISERGRALQMNAGAALAQGDYLLFLHADTTLPAGFVPDWLGDAPWGFFSVRLSGRAWLLRVVEWSMSWRSRLSAIGTGDQGLFVRRELFQEMGGFPAIPLMEDLAICRRLKRRSRPRVLPAPVLTSSRRWEQRGIARTILTMWCLRLAYFVGVPARSLVRRYYPNESGFSR